MPNFKPEDGAVCIPAWQDYKREFRVRLQAAGLTDPTRQVGTLLKCMGIDAIKLYDTFEWKPAVDAIAADDARGVVAVAAVPADNKNDLDTVIRKFDVHWGVQRFRSIKRQEFLDTKRGQDQSIMDYVSALKRQAEHCDYGVQKDGFICDMIINGVNDERCSERLLDLPDEELTLEKVIQVCRQVELTKAHLKCIESKKIEVKAVGKNSRPQTQFQEAQSGRKCDKCLAFHDYGDCQAIHRYCNECGNKGHYAKSPVCYGQRS